ncbi:hypothetical protein DSCO28_04190 [Desulfosarcina ovata subsp. sediminis]|uniref:HYDIN/VesB/CFA65-like Ig-like domain-containing protein n=1 Tax=Desulfosarcina ovata subsp. sediminis TaxID=885957 RepID=A0A5K7ZQR3_9BACT|nr:DUF1573 domain-containing protein [Desulfosarcina ovata]BBO79853.1 hypothetical protein DSCO28_04190 [Desulfosarcina ovata subsp. sediminis]
MKHFKISAMGFLMALVVYVIPFTASAQELSVDPTEYDFGNVVIGESSSMVFTMTNLDGIPISVYYIALEGEGCADFFISSDVPPNPIDIPIGETSDINVMYTPTDLGMDTCTLVVQSDGTPNEILVRLTGFGIEDEPEPAEEMAELIEFFEACVDDGTVEGYGCGKSSTHRLRAFDYMLHAANDLIAWDLEWCACKILDASFRKSDGKTPPPDFITGDNREAVNEGILDVMNLLGCIE